MSEYIAPESLLDAERSVIGALLLEPALLDDLDLEVRDFVDAKHQVVFGTMRNLAASGIAIDLTTIGARIGQEGKLDAVGGVDAIGAMALYVPTTEHVLDYASFVRDESIKRRVAEITGAAVAKWRTGAVSGRELLDEALHKLNELDRDAITDETQTIGDLTREHIVYLEAEARRTDKGSLSGITTGVDKLDRAINGWPLGIASVVCARPGHGKSTLLLATADVASAAGKGVHVFSMEDPRRMYMNRVISRISLIPTDRIQSCEFNREDMPRFAEANKALTKGNRPWIVDDRSGLTAEEIVRSVRRHRKTNGTKLVIVDYIQLVKRNPRSIAKSRHESISETFNELADAAKNDGMAYVVASQLNRDIEKREDKRPHESDMRESGTLEERSKCIVGLYRGSRYSMDPKPAVDVNEDGTLMNFKEFTGSIQLLILKNSQGQTPMTVVARWSGETARVW